MVVRKVPAYIYLFTTILVIILLSANLSAQKIVSLNGSWEFAYSSEMEDSIPSLPDDADYKASIEVPMYWDDSAELLEYSEFCNELKRYDGFAPVDFSTIEKEKQGYRTKPLPYIEGVGYYKKKIFFPAEWKTKSVSLQIGGASQEAWVWINGKYIGYHFGHSTEFEFPLQTVIKYDSENEIVIAVSNLSDYDGGFMLSGYKGRSGGIYRAVKLRVTGQTHFDNCYLYPDESLQNVNWILVLSGTEEYENLTVNWQLTGPVDQRVVKQGNLIANQDSLSWVMDASNLIPWSYRDPKLYKAVLKLLNGYELVDSVSLDFGLRRLVRKGIDLFLNNEPVYLRGVTDHCYFPLTCTPPTDKNSYVKIIKRLKEVGFNWIRFHTWIPNEEYMKAADETGMLLMVEAPGGYGERDWIEILNTCRTHPSVVLYSGGNEQLLDEQKIEWLSGIAELQKEYVPDALFNPQEALRGVEYYWRLSDLGEDTVRKPFLYNPERLRKLQDFSDVFGQYGWGHLSYFAERGDSKVLNERMKVYERPCLSHEIGIKGNYINLDHESRMQYTRIGNERFKSARKLLEQNELIENAATYYNNSCKWLSATRKQILENVRRSKYYRGYDYLGGHDHNHIGGGYEAGVLNEFFELKPGDSIEDLLKINGESVLLLDGNNNHNLKAKELFSSPVFLSHWGNKPIENGNVEWMLVRSENEILLQGSFGIKDLTAGILKEIGVLGFTVPQVSHAQKVQLVVNLKSDQYSITNDWNYWIFPDNKALGIAVCTDDSLNSLLSQRYSIVASGDSASCIHVVSELDSTTTAHIQNGGTVVLLGTSGLPAHPLQFSMGLAGRTHGNLATVIYNHPIINNFPNDGWCDNQFRSLLTDASAVVFNDIDIPFNPIIEVVSSYKYIIKQSCLFELSVGKGRLIVCTLNFNADDPAAGYLLDNILSYAGNSNLCQPTPLVLPEQLIRIMGTGIKGKPESGNDTDNDARKENKRGNIREGKK